jgi:hypothetical protein
MLGRAKTAALWNIVVSLTCTIAALWYAFKYGVCSINQLLFHFNFTFFQSCFIQHPAHHSKQKRTQQVIPIFINGFISQPCRLILSIPAIMASFTSGKANITPINQPPATSHLASNLPFCKSFFAFLSGRHSV